VAPLFIWLILNLLLAVYLKGAGFLIIPVYCGLFLFGYYIVTQKVNTALNLIFISCLVVVPLHSNVPDRLGIKVLFGSALLTVLTFGLLFLVFGYFTKKMVVVRPSFTDLNWLLLKHITVEEGKQNQTVYIYNADTDKASWATYDVNLDPWTKEYLKTQTCNFESNSLVQQIQFRLYVCCTCSKKRTPKPTVEFLKDSIAGIKDT
jgi:hypothetical protein